MKISTFFEKKLGMRLKLSSAPLSVTFNPPPFRPCFSAPETLQYFFSFRDPTFNFKPVGVFFLQKKGSKSTENLLFLGNNTHEHICSCSSENPFTRPNICIISVPQTLFFRYVPLFQSLIFEIWVACKYYKNKSSYSPPPGTHILRQTGMCRSNGSLFTRNP